MNKATNDCVFLEQISIIEEMLSTFTFDIPANKDNWLSFVVHTTPAVDIGSVLDKPTLWEVWYKECGKFTLSSLQNKVIYLLKSNGHFVNEQICNIILVAFTALCRKIDSPIARLNSIIKSIAKGTVSNVFSLTYDSARTTNALAFKDIIIGRFTIGEFPLDVVSSRCRRAKSDYAQKYKEQFGQYYLSVYNEQHECRVVDWAALVEANAGINMSEGNLYALVDDYFFYMSQLCFELFFEEFREAQVIPQAFGSGWLDVDELTRNITAQKLTIWLDIGKYKQGWVSPDKTGSVSINFGGFHIGLPYVRSELKQHFGDLNENTALAKVVKLYCSYLAKARILEGKENAADALLNYVIALDLLLGKKGSSTDSFSARCAALACLAFERDYKDLTKECKQIYDKRSLYVHEGKTPSMKDVEMINKMCREIALCLYRIKNAGYGDQEDFHSQWISFVDILAAKLNANQLPTEEDYKNTGVAKSDQYNYMKMERGMSGKLSGFIPI